MNRTPFDMAELRRRATAMLQSRQKTSKSTHDPVRLLHELQVHQIELELQNEELVSANRDLDALRMRYQTLYESAPVGYLTLSPNGYIVDCNSTALDLLAAGYETLLKRRLRDFVDPSSLYLFDAAIRDIGSQGTAAPEELLLYRPNQTPMIVRAQARSLVLPHHHEKLILFVMTDVTALKSALEEIANNVLGRASQASSIANSRLTKAIEPPTPAPENVPADTLWSFLYVSTASPLMTRENLEFLFADDREFNVRHELTGVLLYRNGNFIQHIEGPRSAVLAAIKRIKDRLWQIGIFELASESIASRNFDSWALGADPPHDSETLAQSSVTAMHSIRADRGNPRIAGTLALLRQFWLNNENG